MEWDHLLWSAFCASWVQRQIYLCIRFYCKFIAKNLFVEHNEKGTGFNQKMSSYLIVSLFLGNRVGRALGLLNAHSHIIADIRCIANASWCAWNFLTFGGQLWESMNQWCLRRTTTLHAIQLRCLFGIVERFAISQTFVFWKSIQVPVLFLTEWKRLTSKSI